MHLCARMLMVLGSAFFTLRAAQVNEPGWDLTLLAEHPQIVTPIGIALDQSNRVFVVESHTHQPKADYPGPKSDQIKIFVDAGNGKAAQPPITWGSGFRSTMNIGFNAAQELFIVQRDKIEVAPISDSAARKVIIALETSETYPHDGLDGLAFGADGWVYFGFGENLGREYALRGKGVELRGGGEGGSVFRCQQDGSKLERIATGFWNPFGLEFDNEGRLFCVDNDPDGRPPCRLIHVIRGGDYGYKFKYGRGGNHPYVAWEGELPGTLGMVSGTGEAPSGILNLQRLGWSDKPALLVTSWGDNRLERYQLQPDGSTFKARIETVVQGDKSFRPVGLAANSDGVIYLTDWADQEYPVHQKGRIWRLSNKRRNPEILNAKAPSASELEPPLANKPVPESVAGLLSTDPFARAKAVTELSGHKDDRTLLELTSHSDARIRLGAILALRSKNFAVTDAQINRWLGDLDPDVRRMALIAVGEQPKLGLEEAIEQVLTVGTVTPALFHTYLATVDLLAAARNKGAGGSVWDQGKSPSDLIEKVAMDQRKPEALRTFALQMLTNPDADNTFKSVRALSASTIPALQIEAIRLLGFSKRPEAVTDLEKHSEDSKIPLEARLEAVAGLHNKTPALPALLRLLQSTNALLAAEAARALRPLGADEKVKVALSQRLTNAPAPVVEQVRLALGTPVPTSAHETTSAVPGNAARGRRVFNAAGCAECHQVNGRGGQVGPDLAGIARQADEAKLREAILKPSANVAPQFIQHQITRKDGETVSGLLDGHFPDGTQLVLADGRKEFVEKSEIATETQSSVSLMPENLAQGMTGADFRDLIAFLLTLK